jgi:probable rRNA maturation factor
MFPDPESSPGIPKLEIFNPSGYKLPFKQSLVPRLIRLIEKGENTLFISLEIIFTNEEEIIEINSKYLNRDYVTDIISFRYDEDNTNQAIEGSLYCCAPRIEEQSRELNTNPRDEYLRIISHGLLHLAGYDDQSEEEKKQMTELEDHYLDNVTAWL